MNVTLFFLIRCQHTYEVLVWSNMYFCSYWTLKNAPLSSCHVTLDDVISLKPRTCIARNRVIVYTNFEAISENFATGITLKFISDVLPPAARGRFDVSWRHRLCFWKAHPCLTLTLLKAIPNISPISKNPENPCILFCKQTALVFRILVYTIHKTLCTKSMGFWLRKFWKIHKNSNDDVIMTSLHM